MRQRVGLGLALVKGIIEAHNGLVQVEVPGSKTVAVFFTCCYRSLERKTYSNLCTDLSKVTTDD